MAALPSGLELLISFYSAADECFCGFYDALLVLVSPAYSTIILFFCKRLLD